MSLAYNEYLAHYGVKGMKWGIRRSLEKAFNRPKAESATWKSKDASSLSDDELRRRLTRLQQEKQYKEMTASRATRARKWIAKTAGKVLVATAIGVMARSATLYYTDIAKDVGILPASVAAPTKKA